MKVSIDEDALTCGIEEIDIIHQDLVDRPHTAIEQDNKLDRIDPNYRPKPFTMNRPIECEHSHA